MPDAKAVIPPIGNKNGVYPITSDIDVKVIRGRVIPCDGCKRKYYCAMYFSATRNRMRNGEYMGGTNIIHHCMIYVPDKIPGCLKSNYIRYNRSRGGEPT